MITRIERDRAIVAKYLPANTIHKIVDGRDVWFFQKTTEVGIEFEIAIYFDAEEDVSGYCAQLVSPAMEDSWKNPHIGHIFKDGVICFGGTSMRTRETLREAYSKGCLWAEGIAIMMVSKDAGKPSPFPFSNNNTDGEVR